MKQDGLEDSQTLSDRTAPETMKSESIQNRFTLAVPAGAVVAAILKSLCCVGPFVLAGLGVSGAWTGNLKAFAPYQPLFMLLTIAFLAVGFYKVYANKPKVCVSGIFCAGKGREKTTRGVLWIATLLVVFFMSLPYLIGWFS